jgi:hypothetical protein
MSAPANVNDQHLIITGIVVDEQVTEGVRVEPGAVPRIEPVGDDILGFTDPSLLITALTDSGSGGRAGSEGRSVATSPSAGNPSQIRTPSS